MGVKEYELPDGRKAVFEFDENGVGKITLEAMDLLMGLIKADIVRCGECKHCEKRETAKHILINYCEAHGISVLDTDYCNWAERRADEKDHV